MLHTIDSVEVVIATGFPKLAWFIIGLLPHISRRRAVRDELVVNQVFHAMDRFNTLGKQHDEDTHVKSAVDFMVSRQVGLAQKDSSLASNWLEAMRDEVECSLNQGLRLPIC